MPPVDAATLPYQTPPVVFYPRGRPQPLRRVVGGLLAVYGTFLLTIAGVRATGLVPVKLDDAPSVILIPFGIAAVAGGVVLATFAHRVDVDAAGRRYVVRRGPWSLWPVQAGPLPEAAYLVVALGTPVWARWPVVGFYLCIASARDPGWRLILWVLPGSPAIEGVTSGSDGNALARDRMLGDAPSLVERLGIEWRSENS